MKRAFYIFLMMVFIVLISFFLYYSIIYCLIFYRIVPLDYVILLTDITLSASALSIVGALASAGGYILGQKYWKIIYVDKFYRFK